MVLVVVEVVRTKKHDHGDYCRNPLKGMAIAFVDLIPCATLTAQTTLQFVPDDGSASGPLRCHWLSLQLRCCHRTNFLGPYQTEAEAVTGERGRNYVVVWEDIVLDSVVVYGTMHFVDDVRLPDYVESGQLGTQTQ